MRDARVALVAAVLSFAAAAVLAGDTSPLAPGTRVRVEVSHAAEKIAGRLLALDDENLSLQVENAREPRVYRREHITALAVSRDRRSRGRGALIGGGIGAAWARWSESRRGASPILTRSSTSAGRGEKELWGVAC
jgi:hypothetical protein